MTGVQIQSTLAAEQQEKIDLSGVFIAIGHKPNTDLFAGQLDMVAVISPCIPAPRGRRHIRVWMAYSLRVMWLTISIDRRSPLPVLAVWQRWMPRSTSTDLSRADIAQPFSADLSSAE